MTLLAAVLAAAAVACLLGLPGPAQTRLATLGPAPAGPRPSFRAGPRAGAVAAGLVGGVVGGPVLAVVCAAAAAGAVRLHRSRAQARARTDERRRAVEACGVLAAELRAGRPPSDALLAAAEVAAPPSRSALTAAAGAARLGGDVRAALRPPAGTAVAPVLDALGACWTVCATSGSGLASAVERLEEGLRAEQAQRRAVDAELAGPRATAALLAGLPVAGLLLATGLGADPVHVLLRTPLGAACLVGGLLLDALGLWWTGRLVARAGGSSP